MGKRETEGRIDYQVLWAGSKETVWKSVMELDKAPRVVRDYEAILSEESKNARDIRVVERLLKR